MSDTLDRLWKTIEQRKQDAPEGSYTASLLATGLPRVAQKVGEEAVETVVAGLSESADRLLSEMADLMYHCMVLLAARDCQWSDVEETLAARFK